MFEIKFPLCVYPGHRAQSSVPTAGRLTLADETTFDPDNDAANPSPGARHARATATSAVFMHLPPRCVVVVPRRLAVKGAGAEPSAGSDNDDVRSQLRHEACTRFRRVEANRTRLHATTRQRAAARCRAQSRASAARRDARA